MRSCQTKFSHVSAVAGREREREREREKLIDNQIGNAKCLGRVATYLARVDTAHTPMHAPSSSALDVLEPCTVVYLKTVGIVSCHCVCVLHVLVVPAGFGGVGFLLVDELARVTPNSVSRDLSRGGRPWAASRNDQSV